MEGWRRAGGLPVEEEAAAVFSDAAFSVTVSFAGEAGVWDVESVGVVSTEKSP
jgi:hypothetical protein